MTKTIVKREQFTGSQLALITRTVAKGASEDELKMFLHISKKAGLDPFLKEIYFYKDGKGNSIMLTSRDGFLSIAQKSGEFTGLQSASVYENDDFSIDYSTNTINHKAKQKDRGNIIGAWAKSFRKNCEPNITYVDFATYKKTDASWSPWTKYPDAMIIKCAESIALKKTYGISGLVSMEEIGFEPDAKPEFNNDKAFEDLLKKINTLSKEKQSEAASKILEVPPFELNQEQQEQIKKYVCKTDVLESTLVVSK